MITRPWNYKDEVTLKGRLRIRLIVCKLEICESINRSTITIKTYIQYPIHPSSMTFSLYTSLIFSMKVDALRWAMIKQAHEQDKSYWGPLNWVPLCWTLRSYYNYKRHGFPCAFRSKYIEISEIIYCQVAFRSQHYILSRENRFFEANWMNKLSVYRMPKKRIVKKQKTKNNQPEQHSSDEQNKCWNWRQRRQGLISSTI